MKPKREERVVLWVRCVPGRDEPEAVSAQWVEKTVTRAHISGASVLLTVGNTVLITFDGIELEDAVEFARHTLDEAASLDPLCSAHIGLSLGDLEISDDIEQPACSGAAFDRAQTLSHRARNGEIVFDEVAEQRAEELFLFAREVVAERVRGHVLDPVYWNKRECRSALTRLKPAPIARSAWPTFEDLRALSGYPGQQRVALHCDAPAAVSDILERLLATLDPSLRLQIGRSAGALRPLGSLALALRRLWPDPHDVAHDGLPNAVRDVLQAVIYGDGVQRREVVEALSTLLRSGAPGRPCVVLEQLHEIDPATLGVVAEAIMAPDLDALVVMTLPNGASVPAQLIPATNLHVLTLPMLPQEDRVAIAEAVLSLEPGAEIAQRVAMLGGDSAFSVVEAVRTLVSSGDLVQRGERFAWRLGPRLGASAVPVEALITERVVGMQPAAYRVLEAVCVSPRDAARDFIEHVALRDGLSTEEFAAGLHSLMAEGFVDDMLSLSSADAAVRGTLRSIMPPARAAELHRFVAELLRAALPGPCFGSGELAYHLVEGGQSGEAALALVDAAHAASDAGFQRVALRLLATAVEWDGSAPVRKAASDLARTVGALSIAPSRPPAPDDDEYEELKSEDLEQPTGMAQAAMRSALHAFATRDYDAVERWLDAAVAAGGGRAAAQRVLAMAHLARGERDDALRTLQRAAGSDAAPEARARDMLSWALLHLAGGDAQLSVRDALAALAQTRQLGDLRGESAALHVLSLCYGMLERTTEARQLEAAAAARLVPRPAGSPHA
jgi:tetratricopeptide (TPR) repeat protein